MTFSILMCLFLKFMILFLALQNWKYQWPSLLFIRLSQFKQVLVSSHKDFDKDICLLLFFRKHSDWPNKTCVTCSPTPTPAASMENRQLIASNYDIDSDDYSNETKVSSWTLIILISLSGEYNFGMTMSVLLHCRYLCLLNLNEHSLSSCTKAPDITRTNACLFSSCFQQMNLITKSCNGKDPGKTT